MSFLWLALPGALIWLVILILPWRPWSIGETLEADSAARDCDLSDVTALIPARNEAETLPVAMRGLEQQGKGLQVVVVDDQSQDATAEVALRACPTATLVALKGPPPRGWSGKLWALEQGRQEVRTPLVLLLDADIELRPGIVAALRAKLLREKLQLASVMALLRTESQWERLLMPAFVYFFKLLYPFRLVNDRSCTRVAAAAGGCVLMQARALEDIGAFGCVRGALIDDCALAARVKQRGFAIWIGLSRSVRSIRRYEGLAPVWNMVARSAFPQLRHSTLLLLTVTAVFLAAYWLPLLALAAGTSNTVALSLLGLATMLGSYLPTLRFYRLSPAWGLALPLIGTLYLAMTWSSAYRWWIGRGSSWKERRYVENLDSHADA